MADSLRRGEGQKNEREGREEKREGSEVTRKKPFFMGANEPYNENGAY
jgi:hypothetical protein